MYQFPRASVTKYYKWGGLKQWEYIKTDFQIRPHSEILRLRDLQHIFFRGYNSTHNLNITWFRFI